MKKLEKIIEYGIYLLVFLLPLQTRWIIKTGELNGGYWEYGAISLYGTDISLTTLLVLFVFSFFSKEKSGIKELKIKKHWWILAGLELMIFISIFLAPNKIVAVYGYVKFLLGIGLFWLITEAKFNKTKIIYSFLLGVFLQAVVGIWQFICQYSLANKWLGMAAHSPEVLGASVVETIEGARWLRAYGGLDHPNVLGGLLVIAILLGVGLILNQKKEENKIKKFSPIRFKTKAPLYFLISVFFLSLFFTFSRGAWIGLLLGLIFLFLTVLMKRELVAQKKLLEIILVFGIIGFLLFNQYQDLVLTRLSTDTRLERKSNIERVESFKTAREITKNHWLFGVGIGNYTLAVKNEIIKDQPSWYYQPVHNVFLLIISEIGIVGFLSLCIFFLYLLYFSYKTNYLLTSIILSTAAMMMVDHWWWSLHFGVLLFWFIAGLAVSKKLSYN